MPQRWPEKIWIVRHGESAGNVAREAAMQAGWTHIDIQERDVDVPLSQRGEEQATALGEWFAAKPANERPQVVWVSPYRRARKTAELIRAAGGLADDAYEFVVDERLREKEFGVLDRLTTAGIMATQPEQAEFRQLLGKFYHRPPGGESWCDVILRLRSCVDTMSLHHSGCRVLIVAHQVVVLCLRYLLENMTEEEILAIDRATDLANCSVTDYAFDAAEGKHGKLVLQNFNFVAPLREGGATVTAEPDATGAAK
jgi:broad specificity phosphatase PhoE